MNMGIDGVDSIMRHCEKCNNETMFKYTRCEKCKNAYYKCINCKTQKMQIHGEVFDQFSCYC